jgi:hypothetical protein
MTRKHRSKTFRTVAQRVERWDKKLNARDYAVILDRVKPFAKELFMEYQAVHESLISKVRDIVSRYGEESQRLQTYMWFAQGVWYCAQRYKDRALQREVNALYAYFTILGLNKECLRDIACSIAVCPEEVLTISKAEGESIDVSTVYQGVKKAIEDTLIPLLDQTLVNEIVPVLKDKIAKVLDSEILQILKDPDVYTDKINMKISYNPDGEISEIVITDKNTGISRTIKFYYDKEGNLISIDEE